MIVLNKISRQTDIAPGYLNITAGNILVQLLVVGDLIGVELPRLLAVIFQNLIGFQLQNLGWQRQRPCDTGKEHTAYESCQEAPF
jgi:hypothetical protein